MFEKYWPFNLLLTGERPEKFFFSFFYQFLHLKLMSWYILMVQRSIVTIVLAGFPFYINHVISLQNQYTTNVLFLFL